MQVIAGRDLWVGIDLGGTKILTVVFDAAFRELGRDKRRTHADEGVAAGVKRMVRSVHRALREAGADAARVAGLGIGCAGPVNVVEGILLEAPNMGWRNVPLKRRLEAALGRPVAVLNDVDAGVYGEYRFGAARHARCVIGIFPGTGIGGGCVYEGRILHGRTLSCFEIGHVPVLPGGPLCGCGQRGCLESVASRLAVAADASIAAIRGSAPSLRRRVGADLNRVKSGMLADAMREGDAVVSQIVTRAAEWVGVAAASAINLLAPDVVLLGGGLVEAMPDLFRRTVAATARRRVMKPFREIFRVVVAGLGDASVAMGAAAWAQSSVCQGASAE